MAKTINPKATPYIRPESDLKVTYLIFPGTADKTRNPPDMVKWKEQCEKYIGEIGGLGAGYPLHMWEDPFKKPEPTPTAPSTSDASTPEGTAPTSATPAAPPPSPPATSGNSDASEKK
ncbi:MAG: hypothetical protein R3F13_14420 [Prosthecobacter sp.]